MKTIFIARHATTKPAKKNQDDSDRPLTLKGQDEAQWLGQAISKISSPSQIVTSSATRAQETSQFVEENLASRILIETTPELYLAPSQLILKFLKNRPDTTETVALVGHNPGLSQFLLDISGIESNPEAVKRIYRGLPPAGLAILECQADSWSDLSRDNTVLMRLLHPGE
ncbi:SixA phosphatase family protein [Kiloniella sp.]|uniref:SixA phosphatase family protein n=1 Tax=Kiloniella sp. TaxID=1938587 RepID=UPI003B015169